MLTYASTKTFMDMKDLNKTGLIAPIPDSGKTKIKDYLGRATRYIERQTRRQFFPSVEARVYPVPYAYYDLAVRRYPSAHLKLDQDLLEVINVNNGSEDLGAQYYFTLEHNVYPKHILVVRYPKYWGGTLGGIGTYKRYDDYSITVKGLWGYADYLYPSNYWIDTQEKVAIGGINDSVNTINVVDASGLDEMGLPRFEEGYLLRIGNELMEVTDVTGNVITVIRGIRGSEKNAHAEDATIYRWKVIEDIEEACLQIAKIWREADLSAGSRIGVSDVSVGAELGIPGDIVSILSSYKRTLLFG